MELSSAETELQSALPLLCAGIKPMGEGTMRHQPCWKKLSASEMTLTFHTHVSQRAYMKGRMFSFTSFLSEVQRNDAKQIIHMMNLRHLIKALGNFNISGNGIIQEF